jgi:hypothetical protein
VEVAFRAAVVWVACAITVIIGLALVVKSTSYGLPLPLLPVAVGTPLWLVSTRRTGMALAVVLLYLGLLDGFLKLKTGSNVATLGRDILLYAVAIAMTVRARGPYRMPPLGGWVVAWTVVILVQLANPGNYSMSHAVASMRQDIEFVPLFFMGFAALRSHASLHAFFGLLLAVATINGAVAAYQSALTPQQLAGWGPGYAEFKDSRTFADAGGKSRVRPPGLGPDEGFGGALGATALPGGIVLIMTYRRRRWLLAPIVLGVVGAAIGVLTSQSRSAVIMAIVAVLALLGLIALARQAKRALMTVILMAVMAVAAVEATGSYNSSTFDRYASIAPGKAPSTIYDSRATTWFQLTPKYMSEIPFGAGLGKVGPAASKVGGVATGWNAETQFTFLIVEAGIPALLVFLAFQGALCSTILSGLRCERDPHTVVLMAALAAPLFCYAAGWFFGVNTTEPPNAPYLWLAAGVISWWLVRRPTVGRGSVEPRLRPQIAAQPGS